MFWYVVHCDRKLSIYLEPAYLKYEAYDLSTMLSFWFCWIHKKTILKKLKPLIKACGAVIYNTPGKKSNKHVCDTNHNIVLMFFERQGK